MSENTREDRDVREERMEGSRNRDGRTKAIKRREEEEEDRQFGRVR